MLLLVIAGNISWLPTTVRCLSRGPSRVYKLISKTKQDRPVVSMEVGTADFAVFRLFRCFTMKDKMSLNGALARSSDPPSYLFQFCT